MTNFSNPSIRKRIPTKPSECWSIYHPWTVDSEEVVAFGPVAASESNASRGEGIVANSGHREGPRRCWKSSRPSMLRKDPVDDANSAPAREAYLFESDDDAMARDGCGFSWWDRGWKKTSWQ